MPQPLNRVIAALISLGCREGSVTYTSGPDLLHLNDAGGALFLQLDEEPPAWYRKAVKLPCHAGRPDQWLNQWADTQCVVFRDSDLEPHPSRLALASVDEAWYLGRVYEDLGQEPVYVHLELSPRVFERP